MMQQLLHSISRKLKGYYSDIELLSATPRSGGDISLALSVETTHGIWFVKYRTQNTPADFYEKEFQGLMLLREANASFIIPKPLCFDQTESFSYLIMECLKTGRRPENFGALSGTALAELHRNSNEKFGLHFNNYMGSIPQSNNFYSDWADFFANERILPLALKACREQKLPNNFYHRCERLCQRLNDIVPREKPSLVHGDLWAGNLMCAWPHTPAIYDPACYFGHRETDLAMTKLFGSFDTSFYQSYIEHFPLEKNWEQRIELMNLYPLLIHVLIFGAAYAQQTLFVLKNTGF